MEQKIDKKGNGANWYAYQNGKLIAGFHKEGHCDLFIEALKVKPEKEHDDE